jgi:hypothetical protein
MTLQRFQTVVTGYATANLKFDAPGWKVEFIVDNHDCCGIGRTVAFRQEPNRLTRQVHERLRESERNEVAFEANLTRQSPFFPGLEFGTRPRCKQRNNSSAHIMPGAIVFGTGIAEPDDEPFDGRANPLGGGASKHHSALPRVGVTLNAS